MGKRVILYLFLLFSLSLQAQSEEKALSTNDSTRIDSTTVTQSSPFKRAIKKFMNFSDFDTLYISPNRYNYALMATHFSNFEYYSVTSEQPQPQKLSFSPNPHNKIGLYFGWRWIFLGWSVDVDDIYRKTNRKNRGTEFDLSLYSSKLGVDIFYRRTGNNYKIHKIRGFSEDIPSNYSEDFSGIKVDIKGLNLYYIFNNRKFSYPAAFSQSTNQRRNAGTFIAGFSISKHHLDFDYTELPVFLQQTMNPGMKVKDIKYTNANISFGYAYNWVFARNCLACLSLTPAIAYKASDVDAETHEGKAWYGKFNLDFLLRAGVVYNNGKGWSVDVDDIYRKTNRKNRGTEFDLSLYSSKLGVDIFYRRTGNNYKIHKIRGFSEDIPSNYSEDFSGIKVDIKGLNLYYIFNNRKFSYPAAFSQSTNQRRNAGTFIAGFSISKHHLDFDYTELPVFLQQTMNPGMKVKDIKYTNANISFGYAYNWVFARNCLACLSLTPAIAYKASDVDAETHEGKAWYGKFNLDFLLRAGVVYNNGKYFVGTSFVGKNYNYHRNNFSVNNGFGTLQIYAGFNFNLRKEYRKKK